MSSTEHQTIVVIGLSGAGLKTINLLLDRLYHHSGQSKTANHSIRLIAIEKSKYAYWPPGALRASVVDGFEDKIVRSFEHIIPQKIQDKHPELVKVFTGTEVVDLNLKDRFIVLDKSLDGIQVEPSNKLAFDYLVIASVSLKCTSIDFDLNLTSLLKTPS
jgi:NADH dehydrogenase FAD-containing subunit